MAQSASGLLSIAEDIQKQTALLTEKLKQHAITEPSLEVGAKSALWTTSDAELELLRNNLFGLTERLSKLLDGPHGFIHELVQTNWELGSLYTVLEFKLLEEIPLQGDVHVSTLAAKSGIQERKLQSILRALSCRDILRETSSGRFAHTAISEDLLNDVMFSDWVRFQLFDTRVASAHLSDSLKAGSTFETGQSAFAFAWGKPMYQWHADHPEKQARFFSAMRGVGASFDPANNMFLEWLQEHQDPAFGLVVEAGGLGTGESSQFLSSKLPQLKFEVQAKTAKADALAQASEKVAFVQRDLYTDQPASRSEQVRAFILKNAMWNLSDVDCVKLLRTFVPAMYASPDTVVLVNDLMSPPQGIFEPHVEKAYRRREVTLMTMHNAKNRTAEEWEAIFKEVEPRLQITTKVAYTSHLYRGMWELRYAP